MDPLFDIRIDALPIAWAKANEKDEAFTGI